MEYEQRDVLGQRQGRLIDYVYQFHLPSDILREIIVDSDARINRALSRAKWDQLWRKRLEPCPERAELHFSWLCVQAELAMYLLDLHDVRNRLRQDRKNARREARKARAKIVNLSLIRCELAMLIVQDIADALAWGVLAGQNHFAGRLHRGHGESIPSRTKMAEYIQESFLRHERDPDSFALISDLGKLIDIGDLVIISSVPPPLRWQLVELKAGEINEKLGNLESASSESKPEVELTPKEEKQLERMQRQKQRADEAIAILQTDKGYDSDRNAHVKLLDPPAPRRSWVKTLKSALSETEGAPVQRMVVEPGLFVEVSKGRPDEGDFFADWLNGKGIRDHLVIQTRGSLKYPLTTPLFMLDLDIEHRVALMLGEIEVAVAIEFEHLFAAVRTHGGQMGWTSKKVGGWLKANKGLNGRLIYNGRGIWFGSPEAPRYLGHGWAVNISHELVTLDSAAEYLADLGNQPLGLEEEE